MLLLLVPWPRSTRGLLESEEGSEEPGLELSSLLNELPGDEIWRWWNWNATGECALRASGLIGEVGVVPTPAPPATPPSSVLKNADVAVDCDPTPATGDEPLNELASSLAVDRDALNDAERHAVVAVVVAAGVVVAEIGVNADPVAAGAFITAVDNERACNVGDEAGDADVDVGDDEEEEDDDEVNNVVIVVDDKVGVFGADALPPLLTIGDLDRRDPRRGCGA